MQKKNKSNHIKLIVNPGAGDAVESGHKLEQVTNYLEMKGWKVDVSPIKSLEKATSIASRAKKKGYKIVIAMGGDGTIEAVMRSMVNSKAHLGIIPSGKENHIAKKLDIPLTIEESCALILSDDAIKLDMGQIKTRKGKKFVFFQMASIGLPTDIYYDANKAAIKRLSDNKTEREINFPLKKQPKFELTLNGESKMKVKTRVVMVSNTPVIWKYFKVAPDVSLQDGLLDVYIYPDSSDSELLSYYTAMLDGGYSGDVEIQHYLVKKLKVKTSPRLDVLSAGIVCGKGSVSIKVLPKALRVISPMKSQDMKEKQEDTTEGDLPGPVFYIVEKKQKMDCVVL